MQQEGKPHPRTRAGDPFFAQRKRVQRSRRTHAEEVEAVAEEEERLGRPTTPGERELFVREFHGESYAQEIGFLAAHGLLDDADGQE